MKDKKTETKQRILKLVEASKPKRHIKTPDTYKKALKRAINNVQKKVERMDTPTTENSLLSIVNRAYLLMRLCKSFGFVGFLQISVFMIIAIDSLGNGNGLTTSTIVNTVDRNNYRHVQIIVLEFYKLGLLERRKNSRQFYVYYLSVYSVERMQELLNEV